MRRIGLLAMTMACAGCHTEQVGRRPPQHVDISKPGPDIRRQPDVSESTRPDVVRQTLILEGPRVAGRKVDDRATTWAFGGEVAMFRGREIKDPRNASAWFGGRAGFTYVRGQGVTDVAVVPSYGLPFLGNVGIGWTLDPRGMHHGVQGVAEFAGLQVRLSTYPGLQETRLEFGVTFLLGVHTFRSYE